MSGGCPAQRPLLNLKNRARGFTRNRAPLLCLEPIIFLDCEPCWVYKRAVFTGLSILYQYIRINRYGSFALLPLSTSGKWVFLFLRIWLSLMDIGSLPQRHFTEANFYKSLFLRSDFSSLRTNFR
jgi:hypothetical protein